MLSRTAICGDRQTFHNDSSHQTTLQKAVPVSRVARFEVFWFQPATLGVTITTIHCLEQGQAQLLLSAIRHQAQTEVALDKAIPSLSNSAWGWAVSTATLSHLPARNRGLGRNKLSGFEPNLSKGSVWFARQQLLSSAHPRVLDGTAEGTGNRPDTPSWALLLSPRYSLAEVSSEPGSKKVTFLPSPGFFTGVLKIKGKELKHTISLLNFFPPNSKVFKMQVIWPAKILLKKLLF